MAWINGKLRIAGSNDVASPQCKASDVYLADESTVEDALAALNIQEANLLARQTTLATAVASLMTELELYSQETTVISSSTALTTAVSELTAKVSL